MLVMAYFDCQYMEKLDSLGINPLLYKRYVDDVNMTMYTLKPGIRFLNVTMVFLAA